ncbi:heme NO-binding protein [Rhodobacterales bacterium HKCCE2091]|nr:heme NO-binding protein [Rhodobacterales bacterium HKCCE2091]
MHGLVNKALQGFLVETYGRQVWDTVRRDAALPFEDFEAMLNYEPGLTRAVVAAAASRLGTTPASLLEDVGTWIVTDPARDRVRRLLRFGGADFRDFMMSVEQVPDRARMALPGFDVPRFTMERSGRSRFGLTIEWPGFDIAPLVVGALRAMADDYGALVLIEPDEDDARRIDVELLDNRHSEGRHFDLGGAAR